MSYSYQGLVIRLAGQHFFNKFSIVSEPDKELLLRSHYGYTTWRQIHFMADEIDSTIFLNTPNLGLRQLLHP